jgi:sialic acid synthase SpsE
VAMGASVVEKHLTLSREDGGPDGAFSMEPSEFARLVVECRTAWEVRGSAAVQPGSSERDNLRFRRSLYVVRHVKKGEVLTTDNVRSIRPAGGLPPKVLGRILGKRAQKDLVPGTPLSWRHVSEE